MCLLTCLSIELFARAILQGNTCYPPLITFALKHRAFAFAASWFAFLLWHNRSSFLFGIPQKTNDATNCGVVLNVPSANGSNAGICQFPEYKTLFTFVKMRRCWLVYGQNLAPMLRLLPFHLFHYPWLCPGQARLPECGREVIQREALVEGQDYQGGSRIEQVL